MSLVREFCFSNALASLRSAPCAALKAAATSPCAQNAPENHFDLLSLPSFDHYRAWGTYVLFMSSCRHCCRNSCWALGNVFLIMSPLHHTSRNPAWPPCALVSQMTKITEQHSRAVSDSIGLEFCIFLQGLPAATCYHWLPLYTTVAIRRYYESKALQWLQL